MDIFTKSAVSPSPAVEASSSIAWSGSLEMWSFYFSSMVLCCLAVAWMLRRYAAPGVEPVTLLTVGVAYLTSVSVVALVPIDVFTALTGLSSSKHDISTLWSLSYWSTQLLTWIFIPLLQGYVDSGDFSVASKLRRSLQTNFYFYCFIAVGGAAALVLLVVAREVTLSRLPSFMIALSNAFGLVTITMFLGYGLVEVPRFTWRRAEPEVRLKWHLFRLGRAVEKLEDGLYELRSVVGTVQSAWAAMPVRDSMRPYLDVVYRDAELYSPIKPSAMGRASIGATGDFEATETGSASVSTSSGQESKDLTRLAKLRKRMRHAISTYNAAQCEYVSAVEAASKLSPVVDARISGERLTKGGPHTLLSSGVWFYHCSLRPYLVKALAVAMAVVSAAVIWSEGTLGLGWNKTSPFAALVQQGTGRGAAGIQLAVMLPLAYTCFCAYYSLFKLGNFSFYKMVPHYTDSFSLLLNASLLARFAAPLCFNFLYVLRMQDTNTVFLQKMGVMQDIPLLGAAFNTWWPLLLVLFCAVLALNMGERISRTLGVTRFDFSAAAGGGADDEHTERGRQLLRREQEAAQRGMKPGEVLHLLGAPETAPTTDATAHMRSALREYAAMSSSDPGLRSSLLTRTNSSASLEAGRDSSVIGNLTADVTGFLSRLTGAVASLGAGGSADTGGNTHNR